MTGLCVANWGNMNYQRSIGYYEKNDFLYFGDKYPNYDEMAAEFTLGIYGIKKFADNNPKYAKPLILCVSGFCAYWIIEDFKDDNLAWKFKFTGREIPIIGWVIHELKGEWE